MRKYWVFVTASLSLLLSAISGSAISVAYPTITSSFNTSLVTAGWVLSIYPLVSTVSMPLSGKAADIFGRKNMYVFCLSLFIAGSFLCALAPNITLLILARCIQGIGGGGFLPAATGIVAEEFTGSRQRAIGLITSVFPIGQLIGPNLGGWMVEAFGWRSIFWFNIPITTAALIISMFLLKKGERQKGHVDLVGAGLLGGSLFAFLWSLTELGNTAGEVQWMLAGLLFIISVILMLLFIRHLNKAKDPIIDLQVLKARPFMAANLYNLVFGACIFGLFSFAPLYATSVYGMSTLQSGLVITPRSIGTILTSTVVSVFLVRWGYRWPMLIGTAVIMTSLVLLGIESQGITILGIGLSATTVLLVNLFLSGAGVGIAGPASNNACIELMPHRVATITGVRGMFRQAGGTISIAITTIILNNSRDMFRGFAIVDFGLAAIILITVPLIFLMPKSVVPVCTAESATTHS